MITTPNNFRDNYVVVLDSLDRDLAKYPDPANYVIDLPETLRNVETIELMSFQITRTETNVNTGNNKFMIAEQFNNIPTIYPIEIPVGEYTRASLITTLNSIFSTPPRNANGSYTASLDSNNMITISHANNISFAIQVNEGSAKLLGILGTGNRGSGIIGSQPIPATSNIAVIGRSPIDLSGVPYLIVYLNDYERIIAPGSKAHKNFLVVPMEDHPVGTRFIISGDQKEKKGIYILTNNQKNIYEMRVSIRRPDGTLYDFKGTDHLLIFRVYRHDFRDFNS